MSRLGVIADKATLASGNLALIHLAKSSTCLVHSYSLSVGRLFVPACIITCEGFITGIDLTSAVICSALFPG